MTGGEVQTFAIAFVVIGLISVVGALVARRWAQSQARRRGQPWVKTDRTVLVTSAIVGVIMWAAVALMFVLLVRTAHQ